MKKVLLLITAGLTIGLNSCKREQIVEGQITEQAYLDSIQTISQQYAQAPRNLADRAPSWWPVVAADLNGATTGLGFVAINPEFWGPHALGVAAFGAGLYSYMAITVLPTDDCGNYIYPGKPIQAAYQNLSSGKYIDNQVGTIHNIILAEGMANRQSLSNPQDCSMEVDSIVTFFANATTQNTSSVDSKTLTDFYYSNALGDVFNTLIQMKGNSDAEIISAQLNYLAKQKLVSSFNQKVLSTYFNTLSTLTKYSDVYLYTCAMESNLDKLSASDSDKQQLSAVYSTARYSAGFWINSGLF